MLDVMIFARLFLLQLSKSRINICERLRVNGTIKKDSIKIFLLQ